MSDIPQDPKPFKRMTLPPCPISLFPQANNTTNWLILIGGSVAGYLLIRKVMNGKSVKSVGVDPPVMPIDPVSVPSVPVSPPVGA